MYIKHIKLYLTDLACISLFVIIYLSIYLYKYVEMEYVL